MDREPQAAGEQDEIPYEDEAAEDHGYDPDDEGDPNDDAYGEAPTTDVAEQLRGLVVYLAANLIDDPDSVEVEARQRGGSVFISLRVPEEELGKVIGRGGRIARAMRTALMISGSRSNVRASLDIED
jgi:predicted RNA-binding protein YlqC (UPF0109 family)